ncbi:MAG: energy-coupling factor transporter transmembrane component T family protein [Myxococcota bacterium]
MTDPRARLVALFCLGVVVLCLEGAPALLGVATVSVGAALAQPRARGWRLRLLGAVALLLWTTAVSQGLFYATWPRTPLFHLGPLVFVREGLVHGLVQALRFVTLLSAGLAVALSTSPDRLLAAMLALGVPYGLAMMGATALRFVPLVGEEALAVRAARARRGRPVWRRTPWAWLALEADLLRPVAARAIRRARALAESLETRGFHPTAPRAVRRPLRMGAVDRVALAGVVGVTTIVAVARALYVAYGLEIWYRPELRPVYAFVRAWL